MNVTVSYKANVKTEVVDELARRLPVIISTVMEVPGGNVALLKPEQVSLFFSEANPRDTGGDIRVLAFAKSNYARQKTERDRAREIVQKIVEVVGEEYSVHVRLYLVEIGGAEHPANR